MLSIIGGVPSRDDMMPGRKLFRSGDGLLLVDPQNDFCPGDGHAVLASLEAAGARLLG